MTTTDCIAMEQVTDHSWFESLLFELSSQFKRVPPTEIDSIVEETLHLICERFGIDRSTLWQNGDSEGMLELTHIHQPSVATPLCEAPEERFLSNPEWVRNWRGTPPAYTRMKAIAFFPWLFAQVQRGLTVVIAKLDALPPEAALDCEIFHKYGTRSAVVVPLHVGPDRLACISFACLHAERNWSPLLVHRLELVAHMVAQALARKSSITARKQAEETLRESELRFHTIANSAPVLIWMSDPDKSWYFFNLPWMAFTGRSLEQESGSGWLTGIHPDDCHVFLDAFNEAFDERKPFVLQCRLRRKDGEYRWLVVSGVPRFEPQSQFRGYIGSCTDITEQKAVEQAAQDLNGLLIKAQEDERARLARELHDDITQRLASLAIDVGSFEQTAALQGEQGDLIRGVRQRLVRLSQDVHSLSYELHPTALIDLGLEEALQSECEQFARRESIIADVRLRQLPQTISREIALALFRIVQEALRNAVRHGHATRIEVSLWGIDSGLQLAVSDNGCGIDPARRRRGPSLGLASMRERIRLLNGVLDIESELGYGTTIVAWVPLTEKHL